MKTNHEGFSTFLIVVLVFVLGLGGIIGYRVAKSDHRTNTSSSQAASTDKSVSTRQGITSNKNATKIDKLDIEEWGVTLDLSATTQTVSYRFENPANNYAFLTSKELEDISRTIPECAMASESITINRAKPGDDHYGSPWTEEQLKAIGKKVGEFYYFNDSGQPCSPFANQDTINKVTRLRNDIPNYQKISLTN